MKPIIQVNHLIKTFDNVKAVNDVCFEVAPGEFFGFLGVNGAGKSTTINMLCTLFPPTSGDATVCGYTLGKHNKEIRHNIGIVFQKNTLDNRLTIKENLFIRASLYEPSSRKVTANVNKICDILEIGDLLKSKFQDLSGGQKRRCEIARALTHHPKILFLDEPTTGLDPKTKKMVWQCIEHLRQDFNMTIFLTTHYMEEAAQAEHIAVIDKGKIIADASPFKLKELYSSDKLRLVAKDQLQVIQFLNTHNLSYKTNPNCLEIKLTNSLSAIPLLRQLENLITSFEVVQGTMEDAFLNLTKKSIEEVAPDEDDSNPYNKKHKTLYA